MLRRNMTSAECQIFDPKGRYLVFTLLFFQMPLMKTLDLNTKIIRKKPKNPRNCESRARLAAFLCRQRWRREERPRSRRALRANALYLRRFDDQGNINLPIPVQIVARPNGTERRRL